MRILVTGATGFVGRWLVRELEVADHEVIGTPARTDLDISDRDSVARLVANLRPDAIAHLAGISLGPEALKNPWQAFRVNVGGTQSIVEAIRSTEYPISLLIAGSSEVYGRPRIEDLPLTERSAVRTDQPYGLSKLAQESVAIAAGARFGIPVVVARSFNHTGPGQRTAFVVPALAERIIHARSTGTRTIPVGNIDVRRDLGDVRDVVRAYRLLVEWLLTEPTAAPTVVNIASERAVSVRFVLESLCRIAGVEAVARLDPALVRADDPPVIVGDASTLRRLTGWSPQIDLDTTLSDVLLSLGGNK